MLKKIKRLLYYALYYGFARHLPVSHKPYAIGAKAIRFAICKHMFAKCGRNVNVEHGADIGSGSYIEIGDNSGIGVNCTIKRAKIGNNVMIGPDVVFVTQNHRIDDPEKPLQGQGYTIDPPIEIGDNVWIGTRAIILPGKKIGKNAVIGAGSVVTKDVPDYAVFAGNPAKLIRLRR